MKISDGVLVYVAQSENARAQNPVTAYRLEQLDIALDAAGPQIAFKGSARVAPGDLAVKFSDGILTVTPGQTLTNAPLRANVTLESANVTPLVAAAAGPELGVGGALKGALTVAGTVGAPTASGDVTLSKLTVARTNPQCAEPKRRTLAIPSLTMKTAWRQGTLSAHPMQAELPKGTVSARLTADLAGARLRFDDLAVKSVPLESVLVDFLCQGYAVSGPLDLAGALAFGTARRPREPVGRGELQDRRRQDRRPRRPEARQRGRPGRRHRLVAPERRCAGLALRVARGVRLDHGHLPDHRRRRDHARPPLHEPRDEDRRRRRLHSGVGGHERRTSR